MKLQILTVGTLITALSGAPALAQSPEDALDYRRSAFRMIVWNFGPMSAMVRGRLEWDDADFARRAERVAQLATQIEEGFPPGSKVGDSEARAEIWQQWPDFQAKVQAFQTEAALLASVARGSDAEATKAQFGKVGATCKACHDNYKQD